MVLRRTLYSIFLSVTLEAFSRCEHSLEATQPLTVAATSAAPATGFFLLYFCICRCIFRLLDVVVSQSLLSIPPLLSTNQPTCYAVCISIFLCAPLSVYLSIHLTLSIHLVILSLPVCVPIYPSVYPITPDLLPPWTAKGQSESVCTAKPCGRVPFNCVLYNPRTPMFYFSSLNTSILINVRR